MFDFIIGKSKGTFEGYNPATPAPLKDTHCRLAVAAESSVHHLAVNMIRDTYSPFGPKLPGP